MKIRRLLTRRTRTAGLREQVPGLIDGIFRWTPGIYYLEAG